MSRFLTKDFLAGLMFVAFGVVALYFGRHLAVGTAVRIGPGFVPRALSYILLGLGGIICVFALVSGSEPVEAPKWKPITLSRSAPMSPSATTPSSTAARSATGR